MPRGDPFPWGYGPIWIDPNYFRCRAQPWEWTETITTTGTGPIAPQQPAPTDEQIRKIVREEIADLPIPFDVPDTPPDG